MQQQQVSNQWGPQFNTLSNTNMAMASVQLVNGNGMRTLGNSGLLQMNVIGQGGWKYVCDDHFDNSPNGATVACRELGYAFGSIRNGTAPFKASFYDDIQCIGTELHLRDCRRSQSHDCHRTEAVFLTCGGGNPMQQQQVSNQWRRNPGVMGSMNTFGVMNNQWQQQQVSNNQWQQQQACNPAMVARRRRIGQMCSCRRRNNRQCRGTQVMTNSPQMPTNQQPTMSGSMSVRLIDSNGVRASGVQGYLQMNIPGRGWMYVCDQGFDQDRNASNVACQELGFGLGQVFINGTAPAGAGQMYEKEVQCLGTESRLLDCPTIPKQPGDCGANQAIMLTCMVRPISLGESMNAALADADEETDIAENA